MLRTVLGVAVVFALLCGSLSGQSAAKKMTNQDVKDLVAIGLSGSVIVDKIHAAELTDFDTSVAALKDLKASNVPDDVIGAMINPHPGKTAPPEKAGDPNDPNAQHDPGIYMYAKDRNGIEMTLLEPTVYSEGKSGGVFASAMTYGIAKMKWKAVVRGAHADVKSGDAGMVFYFYFEDKSAGLSHSSFGTTTPNEFTLVKFDVKKETRETVVMKANAFGASSGTDEKANTGFTFTKIRPGVYKVVPNAPLAPGEYCFLSASGFGGTFGAGAAGANRLFDFAVLPSQ